MKAAGLYHTFFLYSCARGYIDVILELLYTRNFDRIIFVIGQSPCPIVTPEKRS